MSELNTNNEEKMATDKKAEIEDTEVVKPTSDLTTSSPEENNSDISQDEKATIEEKEKADASKKTKRLRDIVDYIEIFVFAVMFVIVLFSFCCRLCTVSGPSMNNTLIDGEKVIISDLFYTPKYGDIIVFHDTNTLNEPVVKRVIATEGETVSITYTSQTMTVTVTDKEGNSSVLVEDYIAYDGPTYAPNTYEVPEGMIFVMGDNRSHSMDSRHPDIGFVDERSILGRVLFRITPISKFGFVD
ncbi:MAG: signal peptidase I [Clostridia bacterium]|nr:signal peptidase I [Clostridia bacterium]